jgi:D-methionine transport system permease protein
MASAASGGGLGSLAITKGFRLNDMNTMYAASILLVIVVQLITVLGTWATRRIDHRKS